MTHKYGQRNKIFNSSTLTSLFALGVVSSMVLGKIPNHKAQALAVAGLLLSPFLGMAALIAHENEPDDDPRMIDVEREYQARKRQGLNR